VLEMWCERWKALSSESPSPSFVFPAHVEGFLQSAGGECLHNLWAEESFPGSPPLVLEPDGSHKPATSQAPYYPSLGAPEVFPGGGSGCLRVNPRCFLLSHVLQGASQDFASGNFLYDEVRIFGNGIFKVSDDDFPSCCIHVENLCPLLRLSGCNFMHFCSASLPVLLALVQSQLPLGTKFLVYPLGFVRDFLLMFGILPENIIMYDPHKVYHADVLYTVEGLNEVADLPACETVEAVRQAVLKLVQVPVQSRPQALIIDRKSGMRQLENADQVEDIVRKHAPDGIQVVRVSFEGLSISEQILTVQSAYLLVGVDGAGLTHSMFLPKGASVIDILPTGDEFGPLPSSDGYGYIHHLATARTGISFCALAVPEAQWGSQSVRCPPKSLESAVKVWAETCPLSSVSTSGDVHECAASSLC